jgi:hypothetical protein
MTTMLHTNGCIKCEGDTGDTAGDTVGDTSSHWKIRGVTGDTSNAPLARTRARARAARTHTQCHQCHLLKKKKKKNSLEVAVKGVFEMPPSVTGDTATAFPLSELFRAMVARGQEAVAGATSLEDQARAMHRAGLMTDATLNILLRNS